MAQKCFDQRDIDVDQDDVNGIQYCDPTANHQNIHFKEKVFYVKYKLSINFSHILKLRSGLSSDKKCHIYCLNFSN